MGGSKPSPLSIRFKVRRRRTHNLQGAPKKQINLGVYLAFLHCLFHHQMSMNWDKNKASIMTISSVYNYNMTPHLETTRVRAIIGKFSWLFHLYLAFDFDVSCNKLKISGYHT